MGKWWNLHVEEPLMLQPDVKLRLGRYCTLFDILPVPTVLVVDDSHMLSYDRAERELLLPERFLAQHPDIQLYKLICMARQMDVMEKSYPVTRQTHPKLIEAVEQYCMVNGMPVPTLIGSHSPHTSGFSHPAKYDVVLGAEMMRLAKVGSDASMRILLGVIGHELGHIYAPKPDRLDSEYAADQFSSATLGSPLPLRECLQHVEGVAKEHWVREAAGTEAEKEKLQFRRWLGEMSEKLEYGSRDVRDEKLMQTGPLNRVQTEELVRQKALLLEERKARY